MEFNQLNLFTDKTTDTTAPAVGSGSPASGAGRVAVKAANPLLRRGQGEEGFTRAEHGAALAATKLGDAWKEKAYQLFERYVDEYGHQPFQNEDFRKWAYLQQLEKPENERAFGAIILKGCRENLIQKFGCGPVTNAKAHSANASIWIKKEN